MALKSSIIRPKFAAFVFKFQVFLNDLRPKKLKTKNSEMINGEIFFKAEIPVTAP